ILQVSNGVSHRSLQARDLGEYIVQIVTGLLVELTASQRAKPHASKTNMIVGAILFQSCLDFSHALGVFAHWSCSRWVVWACRDWHANRPNAPGFQQWKSSGVLLTSQFRSRCLILQSQRQP